MLLTRGTYGRCIRAVALSGILATPVAATAQAVVRTVLVGEQPVPGTDRVHLSRFADMTEQPNIAADTSLDVGDLLWATGSEVLLEIQCPPNGQTPFRFSGAFRVVVLPPRPDVACVLQLLAGGVDVRAEDSTEVNAGGIVLGSRGTQYAVRLRRSREGPVCETVVYDDDLQVTPPGLSTVKLPPSNGWSYNFATRRGFQGAISEQMVTQSARIATAFDLTRLKLPVAAPGDLSPEAQRQAARNELMALHLEALKAPANPEVRVRLGTTQEKLGIADGARYNLRKAGAVRAPVEKPAEAERRPVRPEALSPGTSVTSRSIETARRGEMVAVVDPTVRALELVRAGNPSAAIEILRPRVQASTVTARDFYVLAEAYVATQDRAAARKAAEQALGSPDAARVLTQAETERLRAVLRGPY